MKNSKQVLVILVFMMSYFYGFSQCADTSNIYSFTYAGHSYEVVKENKTWTDAAICAVDRNGYLAEINDEAEQEAIFDELANNAGIDISNTENQFGTASVWIGGSDSVTEGEWIWDGNNDGGGIPFWSGGPNGSPVAGHYTNWGTSPAEPDNSGGQDHLTIIIKPTAVNFGLWNDLVSTNSIYYLIESDNIVSTNVADLKKNVRIYPNPVQDIVFIENNNTATIDRIAIVNFVGQQLRTIAANEMINSPLNIADLERGMYLLIIHFEGGEMFSQKFMKE